MHQYFACAWIFRLKEMQNFTIVKIMYRCDRILWLGKGIKQLEYKRTENKLSDHRPVSSIFSIDVEVFDQRKLQRALNYTTAVVHPEVFLTEDGQWSY